MSVNVIIGEDTVENVNSVRLQDADNAGEYITFPLTDDANATASDILSNKTAYVNGVKITGNYQPITPSGNINITSTSSVNVTNYATAQVVESNLIAENIKNGVSILGVTGSYQGLVPTGNQDIDTLNEYNVANKATARVSATERAKIVGGNIKKDVVILGVTGTYEGGGSSQPTLFAPIITVNGNTVSWANDSRNGGFSVVLSATIDDSAVTSPLIITPALDEKTLIVTVSSSNFTSNSSTETLEYILSTYSITKSITNGTASGDSTITENGTATVTLSANTGYSLPSTVTVTNATSSYDQSTGVISLSSPTGNVTITATCVSQSYQVSGSWEFDDAPDVSTDFSEYVNFTSNSESFDKISISGVVLYYSYLDTDTTAYSEGDQDPWKADDYEIINFGSTAQTVSQSFYVWLTSNATQI